MKQKTLTFALALAFASTSCINNYDDFEIRGTVVGHETCTTMYDQGYVVELESPENVGGDYRMDEQTVYHNVVVVYRADRMLKKNARISGRIYLDPNHSDAECNYHYRASTGDVPEACFTKLKVEN